MDHLHLRYSGTDAQTRIRSSSTLKLTGMCPGHGHSPSARPENSGGPPDWEHIPLPASSVLVRRESPSGHSIPRKDSGRAEIRVTDAHCHPTDLDLLPEDYDGVGLGALAAMATVPEDQDRVTSLSSSRPWTTSPDTNTASSSSSTQPKGPRVVACFGDTLLGCVKLR